MPYYRSVGDVPAKRHTQFRQPDGTLYHEALSGAEGFSAESTLTYHRHMPTTILSAEEVELPARMTELLPNKPLLPRHHRPHQLPVQGDAVYGRIIAVGNADVEVSYFNADQPSPLYRSAIGDELTYIESGSGTMESTLGTLRFQDGDYVYIPTSLTHRWVPDEGTVMRGMVIASSGHVRAPKRYLSPYGQFLEHAPFSERDLRVVEGPFVVEDDQPTEVHVRHRTGMTRYLFAHHPFDAVGWDGCFYPYAFSIHDFEPIVKKIHTPPPTHQTFEGPNFVVCSFCPRPFDWHENALPVPMAHANVDSDEWIYWVVGDPMTAKHGGVTSGSTTLHPAGFIHGPQPGRAELSLTKDRTEELFVMVDTFRPLQVGAVISAEVEDSGYPWSWARGEGAIAGYTEQFRPTDKADHA